VADLFFCVTFAVLHNSDLQVDLQIAGYQNIAYLHTGTPQTAHM